MPEGWNRKRRSDISGRPCFDLALPLCETHLALLNGPSKGAVKLCTGVPL